MAYGTIILEKKNKIATITLNRLPVNSLNRQCYEEILQASKEVNADPDVKVVVLTGAGEKAFAAGLDIKEVAGKLVNEVKEVLAISRNASEELAAIGKPVIAAINGMALGGGLELALCCDIRIASDTAKFGQPEINLGIIPGGGATQRLTRLIGASKAKELFFTGNNFDAQTALALGILSKVVPAGKLMEEATALAASIAVKPAVALKIIKQSVDHGLDKDLHSGLIYEGDNFIIAFTSEDGREGIKAFTEKRTPDFKDK